MDRKSFPNALEHEGHAWPSCSITGGKLFIVSSSSGGIVASGMAASHSTG